MRSYIIEEKTREVKIWQESQSITEGVTDWQVSDHKENEKASMATQLGGIIGQELVKIIIKKKSVENC